ncbi:MAG: glutathione S-transferase family protein [Pseudohongiellaceae bacterium]
MILLHHLRIGRSIFMVWQLEEFGVEYDLKVYHRDPTTFRAPPELQQAHPLGKSPVIEDGDILLSESSAITSYLLEKYDPDHKLSPKRSDLTNWAKFTQWLHYPEGSVFLSLLVKMLLARSQQDHVALTPYSEKEIPLHLGHIADQLGDNDYILGNTFSAADFGVCYVVSMAKRLGVLDPYPTLNSYLERNLSRPAYARAIERAVE